MAWGDGKERKQSRKGDKRVEVWLLLAGTGLGAHGQGYLNGELEERGLGESGHGKDDDDEGGREGARKEEEQEFRALKRTSDSDFPEVRQFGIKAET